MSEGMDQPLDALCRRQCAFALYRLPGEHEEVRFCMQADGGTSSPQPGERGFLLAPFDGVPLVIRCECERPLPADVFCELPPLAPACPATTQEEYHRLFALYQEQMPNHLQKIVLARTEDVPLYADFSPTAAFRLACERSPLTFNALVHTPEHGTWLCCTPELLLRRRGEEWSTMALAGTRPAGEDAEAPWDAKNRREQRLVADYIHQCLSPLWEWGDMGATHTLRTGMIEHLCTHFRFRMRPERLHELLSSLPPTPAVCGYPPEAARAWLRSQPDIERSLYAGYQGPVGDDEVQLFVTLRCMRVYSSCSRLYAGGGLMPDSDAASEWRETQAKMQPMLQLLQP